MKAIGRVAGATSGREGTIVIAEDALWVPFRGALNRLPIEDIVAIEAERDYVRLHSAGRSYLVRATISSITERLGSRFLRIHRSSIIARDRVTALRHLGKGRWVVVIDDEREVPIGRTYLDKVRVLYRR